MTMIMSVLDLISQNEFDTTQYVKDVPIIGPRKIPKLPENAKKENARAWVLAVLFSLIMVRIVLQLKLSY